MARQRGRGLIHYVATVLALEGGFSSVAHTKTRSHTHYSRPLPLVPRSSKQRYYPANNDYTPTTTTAATTTTGSNSNSSSKGSEERKVRLAFVGIFRVLRFTKPEWRLNRGGGGMRGTAGSPQQYAKILESFPREPWPSEETGREKERRGERRTGERVHRFYFLRS